MPLLTAQNFDVPPYDIPNLDKVGATFTQYLTDNEAEVLKQVLGSSLYTEFIAGLAALPSAWSVSASYVIDDQVYYGVSIWKAISSNTGVIPVEGSDWTKVEDNRWLKLRDGYTYVFERRQYTWVGMVTALVPYIFSTWLRDNFDSYSGNGIVLAKVENSMLVSPATRIIRAHNKFANYIGNECNQKNTLYGFVVAENSVGTFDDTFDETFHVSFSDYYNDVFVDPGKQNLFDL